MAFAVMLIISMFCLLQCESAPAPITENSESVVDFEDDNWNDGERTKIDFPGSMRYVPWGNSIRCPSGTVNTYYGCNPVSSWY